jgi:hypothetical protein
MSASGERDRVSEFGERAAVANFQTGFEMDGWSLVRHRVGLGLRHFFKKIFKIIKRN